LINYGLEVATIVSFSPKTTFRSIPVGFLLLALNCIALATYFGIACGFGCLARCESSMYHPFFATDGLSYRAISARILLGKIANDPNKSLFKALYLGRVLSAVWLVVWAVAMWVWIS
jgi:hypothetical protein